MRIINNSASSVTVDAVAVQADTWNAFDLQTKSLGLGLPVEGMSEIYRHNVEGRRGGSSLILSWSEGLTGPGDVVRTNDNAGVCGQISKADINTGIRQPPQDHGQLARSVGHGEHHDFQLAIDFVTAGP